MKTVHYYKVLVHDYCDQTYEEKTFEVEKESDIYSYFGGREAPEKIEYMGSKEVPSTQEEEQAILDEEIKKRIKCMDDQDGYIVGYYPKGKIEEHYSFYAMPKHELSKSNLREIYSKLEKDPYFDEGLISIERYSLCKNHYSYSGSFAGDNNLLLIITKKK